MDTNELNTIKSEATAHFEKGEYPAAIEKFNYLYENGSVFEGTKGLCLCYEKIQLLSDEHRSENNLPAEPWKFCYHFGRKTLDIKKDADILVALARLYISTPLQNVHTAIDYAKQAMDICPGDIHVRKTYAHVLSHAGGLGNLEIAISLLEEIKNVSRDKDVEQTLLNLKEKYHELRKNMETRKHIFKSDDKNIIRCSFCGKNQHQVKKLVAGPGVYICEECVDLCCEIFAEEIPEIWKWRRTEY